MKNGGFDLGDNGDWGGYEKRFKTIDITDTHEGAFCVALRGVLALLSTNELTSSQDEHIGDCTHPLVFNAKPGSLDWPRKSWTIGSSI